MQHKIEYILTNTLFDVVRFLVLLVYILLSPVIAALLLRYADAPQNVWLFIATDLLLLLVPLFLYLRRSKRQSLLFESQK